MIVRFIITLFVASSPCTVLRAIITVIINALKRIFTTRTFAHICQKIFNVVPSLTNRDTAPTITRIQFIGRKETSLNHIVPCGVQGVIGSSMSQLNAPTRLCVTRTQVTVYFDALRSAFTLAKPRSYRDNSFFTYLSAGGFLDYRPTTKNSSRQIYTFAKIVQSIFLETPTAFLRPFLKCVHLGSTNRTAITFPFPSWVTMRIKSHITQYGYTSKAFAGQILSIWRKGLKSIYVYCVHCLTLTHTEVFV